MRHLEPISILLSVALTATIGGCCGGDDDDVSGGLATLKNQTPYYVHYFLPDQVLLYVAPNKTIQVDLDEDNDGRFLVAIAPGQKAKGSDDAHARLCCDGRCGLVTATWSGAGFSAQVQGSSCGGEGSCPYVYAHDGHTFRLQGEALTGALNRGAWRHDALVLPALRPFGGRYQLRIASELPERDFIDSAALQLYDHALGARVALDGHGRALALHGLQPPVTARDAKGTDRRAAVSGADGQAWIGRHRAADQDTLELEFARPASATTKVFVAATLLVEARNTPFILHTYHMFMYQFGPGWPKLMRWMSELPWYRGSLERLSREAGLGMAVEFFDGERWIAADWIAPVGTAGPRAVAVSLALPASQQRLRVRLRVLPGAWEVDRVQATFQAARPPGEQRIMGVNEADQLRKKQKVEAPPEALLDQDERYQRLEPGDALTLSFKAPALPAGGRRTAVLRLSGYYEELDRSPKPCMDMSSLFRCLAGDRCFARFALDRLARQQEIRIPDPSGAPY